MVDIFNVYSIEKILKNLYTYYGGFLLKEGYVMKKGFTLLEVMSVIIVLGMVTFLVVPNIISQVKKRQDEVDDITEKMIYSAAELYINERGINITNSNTPYCKISLNDLVNDGLLRDSIATFQSGREIPLDYVVKVTLNEDYNQLEYGPILAKSSCK